MCEGHHHGHRSSHHSNGLIRFNVHLNHLKWNESLMKTVEPDVEAWSSTNQRTFINKGFQFLRSESKELKCFSERRWDRYPWQPTSATMHFSFQLGEPWSAIIFSYFPVFFLFQKAILSSIGTVSSGPTKQIFLLRDMTKASTCFVVWQISWGKCFIENALSSGSSKKTVQSFEVARSP